MRDVSGIQTSLLAMGVVVNFRDGHHAQSKRTLVNRSAYTDCCQPPVGRRIHTTKPWQKLSKGQRGTVARLVNHTCDFWNGIQNAKATCCAQSCAGAPSSLVRRWRDTRINNHFSKRPYAVVNLGAGARCEVIEPPYVVFVLDSLRSACSAMDGFAHSNWVTTQHDHCDKALRGNSKTRKTKYMWVTSFYRRRRNCAVGIPLNAE